MGNIFSRTRGAANLIWANAENKNKTTMSDDKLDVNSETVNKGDSDINMNATENESDDVVVNSVIERKLSPTKQKELDEFHKELAKKREARKKIIKEKSDEMNGLRQQLEEEKLLREELIKENDKLKQMLAANVTNDLNVSHQETSQHTGDDNQFKLAVEELENQVEQLKDQLLNIRTDLSVSNLSLQNTNGELAMLSKENVELRNQISALKDVNRFSKEMMNIREIQITQLREKLNVIEEALADREMRVMSTELKQEYERQLQNIRNLRIMYEERARLSEMTRLSLVRELDLRKADNEVLVQRNGELKERNKELENQISDKVDLISSQESELGLCNAEIRNLQAEMSVINKLFSQMLMGYHPAQDLDKLVSKLEENHDLLKDVVVRGEGDEGAAALPRMLLDLLNQVDDKGENTLEELQNNEDGESISADKNEDEAQSEKPTTASAKEIVGNLPKVWKVLMELLSHQSAAAPPEISEKSAEICYKSVETPSGPRLVPSVSKTYIRLKDLILEKKSLQKETNRLKQLNTHLESRLQDHEKRLGMVSSELSKTWRIVGKMQRAHQQLHTHEKILRYELQQKRKMLTELKEQLEFCKEKWDKAKQKNSESQIQWDKLRLEFKNRKLISLDSTNNSAESGYSDEKPSDTSDSSDDEDNVSERKRSRRKTKSPESNRAVNPQITFLKAEDTNDSDTAQEEELPLEGTDILSDGDSQANLADTEDQSISETVNAEEDSAHSRSPVSCLKALENESTKLNKLEKRCCALANKVEKANNEGVELCTELEKLHNQYGGGGTDTASTSQEPSDQLESDKLDSETNECSCERQNRHSQSPTEGGSSNAVDLDNSESAPTNKYILEYEKRFAAREARLRKMEEQTKTLVKKVADTSTRSAVINFKLDELHNVYGRSEDEQSGSESIDNTKEEKEINKEKTDKSENTDNIDENQNNQVNTENETESTEEANQLKQNETGNNDLTTDQEPISSTSAVAGSSNVVTDLEARFAARDERLKKMEELATSLVKQVSDTTTRGVKIGYKLDELHNVYGRSEDHNSSEDERPVSNNTEEKLKEEAGNNETDEE